jgi:hypothetical protein
MPYLNEANENLNRYRTHNKILQKELILKNKL